MQNPLTRLPLLLAAALLVVAPAEGAAPVADAAQTVRLEHFMFAPTTLTVAAGTTVRWQNLDGEPHTVVSVEGLFRSGALDQGDSYSYTFKTAGRYRVVCTIHPQMVATIVVTAP
ncbi:MAG TPA: plastocyanin/azurin family copper-binding protein [Steroidobacteraceae bacterium]|nr:plastocyanin/azurin family copper-binding protein [Steroidobacteraceae bacterium]